VTSEPPKTNSSEESRGPARVRLRDPARAQAHPRIIDSGKAAKRTRGRPFRRGTSGNPGGRPKGSRNATTLAAEALLQGEAKALTRVAIEKALDGDNFALALCLDRVLPRPRERVVTFAMPPLETLEDPPKAINAIMAAVARGEVTPGEAGVLSQVWEAFTGWIGAANREGHRLEEIEAEARAIMAAFDG